MSTEQSQYYLNNRDEFFMEDGHQELLRRLKRCIKLIDGPVLSLDVGSNKGDYIQHLKELCPEQDSTILVFEPNPVNLPLLQKHVESKSNIHIYPVAVSNISGTLPFYTYTSQSTNYPGNTLACLRGGGSFICNVDVITLDSCLSKFPNHIIKYVKIDTEGNDTKVIQGMVQNLHRVKYIVFECSDCLDDHRGPGENTPMRNIVEFLDQQGFDTYRIGTKRLLKVNGEGWNEIYERVKYHSNCFSIKKNDPFISELINSDGYFI